MQAEKPSQTASMVAALRGLAAYLPAEARLVEDPYGLAFGGKLARGAARMLELAPELSRKLTSTWQSKNVLWLQLRTRAIDDALRAFAADGGKQVVLLGAGFDCRALRMREQLPGVQFFEVDHPATQAEKKRVLSELRAESPARYLAWNFEQDPMPELPARLSALGLDRTQRVFTVWEGVSMYLTEPAIVATLATVRAYAPPSSQLVFTYIERAGLARPSFVSRLVASMGEPFTWGWDPSELGAWLARHGYELVANRSMSELSREHLPARFQVKLDRLGRRVALARIA